MTHERELTEEADLDVPGRESQRARERRLSLQAQLIVTIDKTGWLRSGIEVVYERSRDLTIRPLEIRVGPGVADEDVLANGGPVELFARYNRALAQLRDLERRLTAAIDAGQIEPPFWPLLENARQELAQLDNMVEKRQTSYMGSRVTRLYTVMSEIEFLENLHGTVAWVVMSATSAVTASGDGAASCAGSSSWDDETQELELEA